MLAVTYQDSCHLAHAQRIRGAPRQILRAIPGVRLVEMRTPDRCCGSAGIYSLTQPEMSLRCSTARWTDIARPAQRRRTANPGCMAQLEAGLAAPHARGAWCTWSSCSTRRTGAPFRLRASD